MTEHPVMVVYCVGPPGARHARFIVAVYRRFHANPAVASHWVALEWWEGKRLRRVEQPVVGASRSAFSGEARSAWLRYHFLCDECDPEYEVMRNEDERAFGGKMFAVFDRIWASGAPLKIPVRELVRQIDRLK